MPGRRLHTPDAAERRPDLSGARAGRLSAPSVIGPERHPRVQRFHPAGETSGLGPASAHFRHPGFISRRDMLKKEGATAGRVKCHC